MMNSKYVLIFFVGLMLVTQIRTLHGIDINTPFAFTDLQCFVEAGAQFFAVRGYTSDGDLDPAAFGSIHLINQLGLQADIFMESCRAKNATEQVNTMLDSLPNKLIKKVWIVVKPSLGICTWAGFPAFMTCEFLKEMIAAVKGRGIDVGVSSDYYSWQSVFKSISTCTEVGEVSLWFTSFDKEDNLNSYRSFGGWSMPEMKRYANTTDFCHLSYAGLNYRV